ncbi:MAG: hypothetical protein QME46_09745 [Thermoanaerobacteraceae bacterium]|nr:hypothetical protein [Thermoanaerobacteraceae bacterium]
MSAQIILNGGLNWYAPDNNMTQNVLPGSTIREALQNLNIPLSEVSTVTLEDNQITMDYRIEDNDIISVYPIISGG